MANPEKEGWEHAQATLRLREHLFDHEDSQQTVQLVEGAFKALIANISRLIEVCETLLEQDRFSSASLFHVTADEEIGKCFVLLDACRFDSSGKWG